MLQLVPYSEWIIPAPVLFAIAWVHFNKPPTNRSGTTLAMFSVGLIIYCLLIAVLWLLVIVMIDQGSIGFGKNSPFVGMANPEARVEFGRYAPLIAALVLVAGPHFSWYRRFDRAARTFCITLAAIPREADRLALELAQTADFRPKSERLRAKISNTISKNIGARALNFEPDDTLASRFTRAVGIYWMFLGDPADVLNGNAKTAYARILQVSKDTADGAAERYEELIQAGLAYFATSQPTKGLEDALKRSINEVSLLTCSLIARYVLYVNATESKRRQRLATMGFDTSGAIWNFGADQWLTTTCLVVVLSAAMMAFMPGTLPLATSEILKISITFGISIGFAVIGAFWVAQRFLQRHQGQAIPDPPITEFAIAALVVAGLSAVVRIAIPLVPALIQASPSALPDAIMQFVQRWPGLIIPFACTISLGLLCTYLGARRWSFRRAATLGALGNGSAFVAAAVLVGQLLGDEVLSRFYQPGVPARLLICVNSGLIGAAIGAIVLWQFKRSELARQDSASRVGMPPLAALLATEELDAGVSSRPDVAELNYGGYARDDVKHLEGRYICFRPAFACPGAISAYLMDVRWDHGASCLMFEEKERADAGHAQRGRVYIPDKWELMSFVTVERGALRLVTVSRPKERDAARGLIMTLSSHEGAHTPASAPIVLRRADKITQLGFIRPGAEGYEEYRRELEAVEPASGFFASAPPPAPAPGPEPEPELALAAE
jgi:hypothetical protein